MWHTSPCICLITRCFTAKRYTVYSIQHVWASLLTLIITLTETCKYQFYRLINRSGFLFFLSKLDPSHQTWIFIIAHLAKFLICAFMDVHLEGKNMGWNIFTVWSIWNLQSIIKQLHFLWLLYSSAIWTSTCVNPPSKTQDVDRTCKTPTGKLLHFGSSCCPFLRSVLSFFNFLSLSCLRAQAGNGSGLGPKEIQR